MRSKFLWIIALLAGCASFPTLDATIDETARNAPFPDLINIDELRRTTATSATDFEATTANLATRIRNLNARASQLRGPVIDTPTRTRMLRTL